MSLEAKLQNRDCPVCRAPARAAAPFLRRLLDEAQITKASFASRKTPEFMCYGFVRCRTCATVFADQIPPAAFLANAYHEASYDTAEEASYAAMTYAHALKSSFEQLPERGIALEIGTGTGVFLAQLQQAGFQDVIGIEPSQAAMEAADPHIRSSIRKGVFEGHEFPPESLSLICCFQTMEHVPEPRQLVEAAFRMLKPGGMLALITHDYTAPINRLLGSRSPIIDIEHLQLFNPSALRCLLTGAGFVLKEIHSFRNTYPLGYWVRLLPLPRVMQHVLARCLSILRISQIPMSLNVGNVLAVAIKP